MPGRSLVARSLAVAWPPREIAIARPVPAGVQSSAATVSRVLRHLRGTANRRHGGLASPNNLWRGGQKQPRAPPPEKPFPPRVAPRGGAPPAPKRRPPPPLAPPSAAP